MSVITDNKVTTSDVAANDNNDSNMNQKTKNFVSTTDSGPVNAVNDRIINVISVVNHTQTDTKTKGACGPCSPFNADIINPFCDQVLLRVEQNVYIDDIVQYSEDYYQGIKTKLKNSLFEFVKCAVYYYNLKSHVEELNRIHSLHRIVMDNDVANANLRLIDERIRTLPSPCVVSDDSCYERIRQTMVNLCNSFATVKITTRNNMAEELRTSGNAFIDAGITLTRNIITMDRLNKLRTLHNQIDAIQL